MPVAIITGASRGLGQALATGEVGAGLLRRPRARRPAVNARAAWIIWRGGSIDGLVAHPASPTVLGAYVFELTHAGCPSWEGCGYPDASLLRSAPDDRVARLVHEPAGHQPEHVALARLVVDDEIVKHVPAARARHGHRRVTHGSELRVAASNGSSVATTSGSHSTIRAQVVVATRCIRTA